MAYSPKLMFGDCLDLLKELYSNSVDAVVTDPPYGLKFMGKKWDYDVPSIEIWKEVLRVLKPGGHLLSFGGTRTYHRMVVNIEDAGFEIKDQIQYLYGSGFPKSLNILKNLKKKVVIECLKDARIVTQLLKKKQTEIGTNIGKKDFVLVNVSHKIVAKKYQFNVIIAELSSKDRRLTQKPKNTFFVLENVGVKNLLSQNLVNTVGRLKQNQNQLFLSISIVDENVRDWLKEKIKETIKVEEVQKILNGKTLSSIKTVIDVICVAVPNVLKLIILNQSKTFQSLDMKLKMGYVSVMNVTITKSIMECLITSMVDILKENLTGFGSALKPSNEPIVLARKPLSEKTIVDNVLRWGTGGLNIDGCRIKTPILPSERRTSKCPPGKIFAGGHPEGGERHNPQGRFPANLILDETAAKMLDEQSGECKTGAFKRKARNDTTMGPTGYKTGPRTEAPLHEASTGGASRFFYCAKASKRERNAGLDQDKTNNHPCVKPLKLMEYLCKLITPPNGTVLDPFMGSGTTGIACKNLGFQFIGIDRDKDYFEIAKKRIKNSK